MDNHHHHQQAPYLTLISRRARGDGSSMSSADSTYGSGSGEAATPTATHDTSRVSYHVKHLDAFAKTLEDSAGRAFPNRGRSLQRYSKVQVLLLHWKSDDLFVLPELEDLEQCLRVDYNFQTDIFAIPSENSHLELMLKVGAMIKEHESTDTLFIVYYGGHARIDESRQSTWCATRHSGSPWLQWSAIQTLLERSASDVLILLDCCAGAASATFPNGKSITETISASSWDAIAPDPGRYSFTNALIEVLQHWGNRTFSAAMLHAEVLARLKHPRPIKINGKHFEARSTPVHFMMTSNHRAPSIELGRIIPGSMRPPSPPEEPQQLAPLPQAPSDAASLTAGTGTGRGGTSEEVGTEPTIDQPHVMISLALEDNQQLDLDAWEQWLASFPALAKHVKVQGVFRSHSTLLLLSLPVMVWDLLPEDPACSFVAFIRSNNLCCTKEPTEPLAQAAASGVVQHDFTTAESDRPVVDTDNSSIFSGTTYTPAEDAGGSAMRSNAGGSVRGMLDDDGRSETYYSTPSSTPRPTWAHPRQSDFTNNHNFSLRSYGTARGSLRGAADEGVKRTMILNQTRSSKRTVFSEDNVPEGPRLAAHVVARLEEYFQNDREPNIAVTEFLASNLGVEPTDVHVWFHNRRQQERTTYNLVNLQQMDDHAPRLRDDAGPRMILPGHLNRLLEIYPSQVLLVDLRPADSFEKSHINQAANLRVPLAFVQNSTFEMIESAFADDMSRRNFSRWYTSKCVVFYDRVVEFTWECPTAGALFDKFKRKGWAGQCFVLKGHYKEFSSSYDRYIVGNKMSKQAKDYADGLRHAPPVTTEEAMQVQEQYDEWLRLVENEGRVPSTNLIPSKKAERLRRLDENQEDLEAEFEARFPALHKKSLALRPPPRSAEDRASSWDGGADGGGDGGKKKMMDINFDAAQGPLVAPLFRGLEKMQEAGIHHHHHPQHSPPPPHPAMADGQAARKSSWHAGGPGGGGGGGVGVKDKMLEASSSPSPAGSEGEYDEIDPSKDEQLRNDPAFQSAGDVGGGASGPMVAAGGGGGLAEPQKKASSSGRGPAFWKRIRSGKS